MIVNFNQIKFLASAGQRWLLFWSLLLLVFLPVQLSHAASDKYVVNLMSLTQDVELTTIKNFAELNANYNVIVYSKILDSGKKYVLSAGYFPDYQAAKKASEILDKTYKGAYAVKFTSNFTVLKSIKRLPPSISSAPSKLVTPSKPVSALLAKPEKSGSGISQKQLDKIMRSAKSALKQGEYKRAVQLFSAVLSAPENKYSREALELLGVARERNDQYNHAVNIYNNYIKKYPGSRDVRRVKQRLAVLITATKRIDKKDEKKIRIKDRPWELGGSLSQSFNNNNGEDVDIYTFLSLTGRKRNKETDLRLQFTGSRTSPLKGHIDAEFQISEMYADVLFRDSHLSTKIGRQRSRSGGLFGRFDGFLLSYDDSASTRYNFLAGIPVGSSHDYLFDTERNKRLAYGINSDLSFLDKTLDLNLYALAQYNDNILDRQVLGAEARFFKRSISVFSLFDYDTSYSETNIFLLTGNWKPANNYNFFFNVDYRNNPLLTTTNALIGQTETDLGTLVSLLGEEAVRQLALDRSTTSRLVGLGLLGPWSDSTTIRGDISTTRVTSSEASGGVPAMPMVGPDYYYSLQFVTTNYFDKGDTTILQFQYSDTEVSRKVTALVTTRIPITKKLRIAPRVILSFNNLELGQNRNELRTSMRTDYKYGKQLQMDVDIGMDFSNVESEEDSALTNYYLIASYHWIF